MNKTKISTLLFLFNIFFTQTFFAFAAEEQNPCIAHVSRTIKSKYCICCAGSSCSASCALGAYYASISTNPMVCGGVLCGIYSGACCLITTLFLIIKCADEDADKKYRERAQQYQNFQRENILIEHPHQIVMKVHPSPTQPPTTTEIRLQLNQNPQRGFFLIEQPHQITMEAYPSPTQLPTTTDIRLQ